MSGLLMAVSLDRDVSVSWFRLLSVTRAAKSAKARVVKLLVSRAEGFLPARRSARAIQKGGARGQTKAPNQS